ncbi:PIG-L family deacetylase, partial [Streptococcus pneumoniae]
MSNNTKYIFLSPHLDDAIFSCGDYISKLTS